MLLQAGRNLRRYLNSNYTRKLKGFLFAFCGTRSTIFISLVAYCTCGSGWVGSWTRRPPAVTGGRGVVGRAMVTGAPGSPPEGVASGTVTEGSGAYTGGGAAGAACGTGGTYTGGASGAEGLRVAAERWVA